MLARRLLIAHGGGSVVLPPTLYSMLFNGQSGGGNPVSLGLATSTDAGATWTVYGSNPVISPGAGGTWDDEQVHGACVIWDGSQWVLYADGYDGTHYRIGRWTSADLITWTAYGSNPIVGLGAGGAFDENGCVGPNVRYDVTASPSWQMWYVGFDAGNVTTLGYADSSDGLAWTKRGQVLGVGAGGAFDSGGVGGAPVIKVGATYYLFYAGFDGTNYHGGYATCASPTGTYTKHGVLSAFAGDVTSLSDGKTYKSNGMNTVIARGSGYIAYGTTFHPTVPATQYETSFRSESTDLVTWTAPTGPLVTVGSGWDSISAENPSVVPTP